MPKPILEKKIVDNILKYLRTLPISFWWKEHGGMYGTAGLPDIIGCLQGQFITFEVKRPGGKVTDLQAATHRNINAAEGTVHVVTSVDEVRDIIQNAL